MAAAAQRHPRRRQVAERRRWVWVGVVTGTRKTHIITFLWTCFDVFVTTTRLLRRLRHCPGRLLCGWRVAVPPGRHCPGRVLLRLPLHRRASGRVLLRIYHRRSGRHTTNWQDTGQLHLFFVIFGQYLRSDGAAAALGCCAGLLRCVPTLVEGHCGELAGHKPRSCCFVHFCWRFLLLLISLLCCIYCVVSR